MKNLKYKTNFALTLGMALGFALLTQTAHAGNGSNEFLYKKEDGATYLCKETAQAKGWLISIDQCNGKSCVGKREFSKEQHSSKKFEEFKCTELSQVPGDKKFIDLAVVDGPLIKRPN